MKTSSSVYLQSPTDYFLKATPEVASEILKLNPKYKIVVSDDIARYYDENPHDLGSIKLCDTASDAFAYEADPMYDAVY